MSKILIIEDHRDVSQMLAESLQAAGYQTGTAYTGTDGLEAAKGGGYDLVLLDIMLPYKSGDQVLRELRRCSQLPVIVISAKDMVGTKIDLLKLGADDYITKPFDLAEVAARAEAILRRLQGPGDSEKIYCYKDLQVNDTTKLVTVNGQRPDLTAKEYQILVMLAEHPGQVFTKANLYESIWQEEYRYDDNAVKTHISNLRSKLKQIAPAEEYIETVWGLGYRLAKG